MAGIREFRVICNQMNLPEQITSLMQRYDGNPVIRGLVQLIPFGIGSAIDVALTTTLKNIIEERSKVFFDELSKGRVTLEPHLLESEDFLHSYFATIKAALNTRRRGKIKILARLLESSLNSLDIQSTDEYEEYLKIIDDISFRELQALSILDSFSDTPRNKEQGDLAWSNTFWDNFKFRLESELGISKDEVSSFLTRLNRTGCYETFTGTYINYTGGVGKLTPMYRKLKKLIMTETDNKSIH